MNKLLTSAKVADLLGDVSEWWVRERCKAGDIPAFKIAGEWRIDPDELAAWRESQRFVRPRGADRLGAPRAPRRGAARASLLGQAMEVTT